MIKENYEQKKKNDDVRMNIINSVMEIKSEKALKCLALMARKYEYDELPERPWDIDEIANVLDVADIKKLLAVVTKMDAHQVAIRQMQEAFTEALITLLPET